MTKASGKIETDQSVSRQEMIYDGVGKIMINRESLCEKAVEMRDRAYTPYSHFRVGAALLCKDGSVYTGCNIENAAYTPANCAERTAFFKAVSEGKRGFQAIAIAGGSEKAEKLDYCPPCGVCRQVMREFCEDNFEVILVRSKEEYQVFLLKELLPMGFGPENLDKADESIWEAP